MADLLVKLYGLAVGAWVGATFGPRWASEGSVAFSGHPIGCHIARGNRRAPGPGCAGPGRAPFKGPEGVAEACRGKGIGAALLLQCLLAMRAQGYGYAIIGGVGPRAFYEKIVPVMEIPGSSPGIYQGMLR